MVLHFKIFYISRIDIFLENLNGFGKIMTLEAEGLGMIFSSLGDFLRWKLNVRDNVKTDETVAKITCD